jgi:hypothetical protein
MDIYLPICLENNMQTAIFVYESTSVTIETSESNLELCKMNYETVSLASGSNSRAVTPGIYKIVSSQDVHVTGEPSAFETVTTNNKTAVPPVPLKATESFAPLSEQAFEAFFAVPDAKELQNP